MQILPSPTQEEFFANELSDEELCNESIDLGGGGGGFYQLKLTGHIKKKEKIFS